MSECDERGKQDFQDILKSIDRKFEIIHALWTNNKLFEVKFRTQIQRNNDDFNGLCDQWVDLFSEATNTVWAKKISNTGPKIRFRKQYQCWTHGGKVVQKELLFDAKRCKATLDMKVLTDNPLTRRKNKHIRMGLNVVVKINFVHLHPVATNDSFAFFVHSCEPQAEAPAPVALPNDRLPQLVAEMVQKGMISTNKYLPVPVTQKFLPAAETRVQLSVEEQKININNNSILRHHLEEPPILLSEKQESVHDINDPLEMSGLQQHHIQLVQNVPLQSVPLQNIETVKLELQPQLQPYRQVVVSGPPLDMGEHILMCQSLGPSLMFDTSQVIPITAHNLQSHFVQVHTHNLQNSQGQFL